MPGGRIVIVGDWGVPSGHGPAAACLIASLALLAYAAPAASQPTSPPPSSAQQAPRAPEDPGPVASPGTTPSDPEPSPELLAQAKVLFRAANEARRGGELREAIRLFARSRSIYPSVPNTLNAALCHEELGEVDRALELYEQLHSDFSAELGAVQLTSLAERIARSQGEVGRLEISADLVGALYVDGVERARLPTRRALYLLPGSRVIRLVRSAGGALELSAVAVAGRAVRFDEQTAHPIAAAHVRPLGRRDGPVQGGGASPGQSGGTSGPQGDEAVHADSSAARAAEAEEPLGLWLTPDVGIVLANGLGSGAERHCSEACESATTVGGSVGLTLGYDIEPPLSLEVALRYVLATEERTRVVRGQFVDSTTGRTLSTVYAVRDALSWMGPLASVGLGARVELPWSLELGAHAHFGIGYFWASDDVEVAAASEGRTARAVLEGTGSTVSSYDWVTLETLELGLRLDPVTLELGVTAIFGLLDGPAYPTGDLVVQEGSCQRPGSDVIDCAPGNDTLSGELAWGPFVLWSPFVSASFPF